MAMAESEQRVSGMFDVRDRDRRRYPGDREPHDERPVDPRALAIAASLIGLAIGASVATAMLGLPM
jgi:hypothetical protein